MDISILDTNFNPIDILETYESLIWNDRYRECGDFEIYTPINKKLLEVIKRDYYLQRPDSEHVMIVEKILIETDVENGNHLTITGRSLESILDRRIVWGQKIISGNLEECVKMLIDECIINPSDENRKIDNFIFEYSYDPVIRVLRIDTQFTGDNLYDIVVCICNKHGIGFKITLNDNKQLVFKLYAGKDRSYDQTENSYVTFSPEFDNILNSNYLESRTNLKNVALIGGEGEGEERKYESIILNRDSGTSVGINRRELFVDARDITPNLGYGEIMPENDYKALLIQRGNEKLLEHVEEISMECEVEPNMTYKYGRDDDYYIGDIVQVIDEYGHDEKARIIEMVTSEAEEGTSIYPTFEIIKEGV